MSSDDTDFLQAFARLLTSEKLRKEFAVEPAKTANGICRTARAASQLASIGPDEIERQAQVLLRKRFALVDSMIPADLKDKLGIKFERFRELVRESSTPSSAMEDAIWFLKTMGKETGYPIRRQLNHIRFLGSRAPNAIHVIIVPTASGLRVPAIQVLKRIPAGFKESIIRF